MPSDDDSAAEPKVAFFDRNVAEELLELVDDKPGEADEALLDEAANAITRANGGLPADAQQAVARGEGVAVGLEPAEVETITALIKENKESDKRTLRSIGQTLKSKLRAAAKKAGRN